MPALLLMLPSFSLISIEVSLSPLHYHAYYDVIFIDYLIFDMPAVCQ